MHREQWLETPRSLLVILFLLTLVSVLAVVWFGWKLLDQERLLEEQRGQEQVQQAADRMVATLRGTLAETGDRLSAWTGTPPSGAPPDEGVVLLLNGERLSAWPPSRLLWLPVQPESEARPARFADGELLEFQQGEPRKAAEWYQSLAASPGDPAVRAGAWLRLARVLRRLGRAGEAAAVYEKLAAISSVEVAGAPAQLVARHALSELLHDALRAAALRRDLLAGRWPVSRPRFEFYWTETGRLAGQSEPPPAGSTALAEAATAFWRERNRDTTTRGERTVWVEGEPFLLIWRGPPDRRAALITRPASLLGQALRGETLRAAVDHEGRTVAGARVRSGRAVVRAAAETALPWTLYVSGTPSQGASALAARQRWLLLGIVVMVAFLLAGTYFIARAIRREMEVSRLQSDFVSAVSHEFRSPLTSLRHLTELLALGRVPNEERRLRYYETMAGETERLQRLVEMLLDFGKLDASRHQYRFEPLAIGDLVERVVAEFRPRLGAGREIEIEGAAGACTVEADPEALALALRNLIDNALKYSPGCPTVWVTWTREKPYVYLRVRDQGAGIPRSEQKRIFEKFVRGSAAASGNVKGTGVGLAMVRRIVAAHGGEIRVSSEPGHGSTFTLRLKALEGA